MLDLLLTLGTVTLATLFLAAKFLPKRRNAARSAPGCGGSCACPGKSAKGNRLRPDNRRRTPVSR